MTTSRISGFVGAVRDRIADLLRPPPPALTPERWQRVQELLNAALDIPAPARSAFLGDACAGDAALRREVESLLAAHERPGLVDRPLTSLVAPPAPELQSGLEPGTAIGHYRLVEHLGDGGMGMVYKARDLRLERLVALKFLHPALGADQQAAARFRIEAQAAAALDHPNICTIHEIGKTDDGRLFIAMQFCDGETLRRRCARGPLPVHEAVALVSQAAQGLANAHERGIVHRDIKPANLIVTADNMVKIVDFGIAKPLGATLTAPGTAPGTVAYMSPEQARSEPVDGRTDIWSLGVVLYELLTGKRPFQGESEQAVLHAIVHDDPEPLSSYVPDVPEHLEPVVSRMLAKRATDRYPTVSDLLRDLSSLGDEAAGRSTVPAAALPPEGERRQATIVVAELADYATVVERLSPQQVDGVLGRARSAAVEVAGRHGGTLNYAEGDAMALAFGIPAGQEDDAVRAVRAALELRARGRELGEELESVLGVGIRWHIGIETGQVIVQPTPGSRERYRITGAPVDAAGGLAAHAPPDDVWIGPDSQRLVGPFFETEACPPVAVRHRAEPLTPYRIRGASGIRSRLEAASQTGLTAFTGREREMAALHRCLDAALRGTGQLVTVVGDAGLGKSRLLHEFRRRLAPDRTAVFQGRCQGHGSGSAYLPFIDLLRDSLGLDASVPRDAAVTHTVARIRAIGTELEEFIPLYLHLLSIPSREFPVPKHLHGEQFRVAMQEAIAAAITLSTRQRPITLLLEDWHWVDDASHAVLQQLAEVAPSYPLLVVVTCRPGYLVDWGSSGQQTVVPLEPLDASASLAVLKSALGADRVPDDFAALIYERTGGNPFFLEEICETLLEDGTVMVENGRATSVRAPKSLHLPETVQAVIRARLDRLDRNARDVLRLASVIGREFTRSILEDTAADPGRLPHALQALKSAGLIQQVRVVPEPSYRFKHVLTQEAAYGSLLERQRKDLHGRVGDAIERRHKERLDEYLERLVHHFSRAGAWQKAVTYGLCSARRIEALSQFTEALQLLDEVQEWLRNVLDEGERSRLLIELLLRQERLCETLGLRGRQQQIIGELIELLEPSGDRDRLAEVYLRQGDMHTLLRQFDAAEAALQRSLTLRVELRDAVGERNTRRSLGLLRWHQDRNEEALEHIERALAIDRAQGNVEAIVGDLANMGPVLKAMGQYERARSLLEEALQLSERGRRADTGVIADDDLFLKRSYILQNLANICRELGDHEQALQYLNRAKELTVEKRLPIQLSYHLTAIAHMHLRQGQIDESLRHYDEAVDLTRRAQFVPGLAQSLRMLGDVLAGLGRDAEALPALEESAGLFAQLRDRLTEAAIWSAIAEAHERMAQHAEALAAWGKARTLAEQAGDRAAELRALEGIARVTRRHVAEPTLALSYYREALELAGTVGDQPAEGRLHNTIGILEWNRGEYDRALAHYEQGLASFQALGDDVHAGLMLNSLGVTLRELGRPDDARRRLEEAIALHRRTGERLLEGHALAALGDLAVEAGDLDQATRYYEDSLAIRQALGNRRGEGWMLHHLARVHLRAGSSQADELAARAARTAADCGDVELAEACARLRRRSGL